ncbi:MAG: hypothetical protein ACPGID_12925 [Rubricella sp.]
MSVAGPQTYFDPRLGARVSTVLPGEHLVTADRGLSIMTLLGSCVAACIRDPETGIGGLNHFLLPDSAAASGAASARYGVHAMEVLINGIFRAAGRRGALEAKVFGGANVMETASRSTVGERNAAFVREFLRSEGIPISAEDLGGSRARRVLFHPGSGRVRVQTAGGTALAEATAAEAALRRADAIAPRRGVELF